MAQFRVCTAPMARNIMLTGLDDLTVTRIRHFADGYGLTAADYVARIADLHERLESLARSHSDPAGSSLARELLTRSRLA